MIENNEKQGSSQKIYLLYIPYSCQSHIPQQKARDSNKISICKSWKEYLTSVQTNVLYKIQSLSWLA